jgi:hypothetical protein
MTSSLHPLGLRILAGLGLSAATASTLEACCPQPTPGDPVPASLGDTCHVEIPENTWLVEQCVDLAVSVCPDFHDVSVGGVCGPLRPGVPVGDPMTGASASASSGAGGAGGAGGGGAGGAGGGSGTGGPVGPLLHCCYGQVQGPGVPLCGRPLVVAGRAVTSPLATRADWCSVIAGGPAGMPDDARRALADAWARDAALEHASVGSFARFVLDLLAVGAPSDLVALAQRAMGDEIAHARACYALAGRHAGAPLGPGSLPIAGVAAGGTLAEIAVRALVEGCIGETVAALVAERALERTTDEAARAALAMIARDEAAHAELAFRFVAWAARDAEARAALRADLGGAVASALRDGSSGAEPPAEAAILAAHGIPDGATRAAALREALRGVVVPCLGRILREEAALTPATARAP